MLIVLRKEEYPGDDAQRAAWQASPDFGAFLEHLADALKSRAHAVEASPKLLEWMAGYEGLSVRQREALGEALTVNQRRELPFEKANCGLLLTGPLVRELPFEEASHGLLLTGPLKPPSDIDRAGTTWIRRDWSWLATRDEPLPKAALVAENKNDSELFVWIGRAMGARFRQADINAGDEVALKCVGGGGSTTGSVYEHQVMDGSPTLCVVDTDRQYKEDGIGDTATKVLQAEKRLSAQPKIPPHAVVQLDAYTVENVVPLELVRLACKNSDWVEPMACRGFFLQGGVTKPAYVDPTLKYMNPNLESKNASAKELCLSAAKNQQLLSYRKAAIHRIRELDETAPAGDDEPLILRVGKLPEVLVKKLEELRDHRRRPGKHPSAAHWLCSQLLKSPDAFADEWEPVARAVWSWGLRFPQTIRERPPTP